MSEKDSPPNATSHPPGRFDNLIGFFSHPLVGILGSISGIIGILLAIYFYLASRHEPHLTYFVHPIRAPLVQVGKISDFSILFKGALLPGDVTAAQIAIWNTGSAPIKSEDVLSPILIQTENNAPILQISIRKISRPVTGISIDQAKIHLGTAGVHWRILEQGDGCVLQVIYLGSPNVKITLSGDVIGQKHLEELRYIGSITTPEEQYGGSHNIWVNIVTKILCWLYLPIGIYTLLKC